MAKYTPAQKKAINKYRAKFRNMIIRLSVEDHTAIKEKAESEGISANKYITDLIRKDLGG